MREEISETCFNVQFDCHVVSWPDRSISCFLVGREWAPNGCWTLKRGGDENILADPCTCREPHRVGGTAAAPRAASKHDILRPFVFVCMQLEPMRHDVCVRCGRVILACQVTVPCEDVPCPAPDMAASLADVCAG